MPPDDPSSHQWAFGAPVDLKRVLDEHRIEHLPVDEQRTFVLYSDAILNLVVTDGTLSATQAALSNAGSVLDRLSILKQC